MSLFFKDNKTETIGNDTTFKPNFKGIEEVKPQLTPIGEPPKTVEAPTHKPTTESGSNIDSLLNHVSTPRQPPSVNPILIEKNKKDANKTADPTSTNQQNSTDQPVPKKPQFYYQKKAEFKAEVSDYVFPKSIAWLNEEDDINPYLADAQTKKLIIMAFARWEEERAKESSPTADLMEALGLAYGLPLMAAIGNKGMALRNRWKENQNKEKELELALWKKKNGVVDDPPPAQKTEAPTEEQKLELTEEEQKPPITECETCKSKLTNDDFEAVKNTDVKIECLKCKKKVEPIIDKEVCLHENCNRQFIKGQGFAKGKKAKYYDKFCSAGCMGQHTSLIGQNARRNKNKGKTK